MLRFLTPLIHTVAETCKREEGLHLQEESRGRGKETL
jgi:hypothetical protein